MVYFAAFAALALSVFSFFYFKSFVKKQLNSPWILNEARVEVQRLINDIEACTDRDTLLVNARVEQLKSLLTEADRRIGAFERDVETRKRRDSAYSELGRKKSVPQSAPPAPSPSAAKPAELFSTKEDKKEKVLLRSAQGASAAEIASEFNMTITEVEMTLVLAKRKA